jgi:3-oxoacyl-(acyl-carrier-protein) synthase
MGGEILLPENQASCPDNKEEMNEFFRKIDDIESINENSNSNTAAIFTRNIRHLAWKALMDTCLADIDPYRTDVIMGSRRGLISGVIKKVLNTDHLDPIKYYNSTPAAAIADMLGTASYVYSSASTSIIHSIGNSYKRIFDGQTDVALAGETDVIDRDSYFSFSGCEVISCVNNGTIEDYYKYLFSEKSSESGAVFIVEHLDSAISRCAKPYLEIESYEEMYLSDSIEDEHNGGHAKNLVSQIVIGLLSIRLNLLPEKLCNENWSPNYIKNIDYVKEGNKIIKIIIGGLTGTGLYGKITLKRFEL